MEDSRIQKLIIVDGSESLEATVLTNSGLAKNGSSSNGVLDRWENEGGYVPPDSTTNTSD
jgi:hypothetical protein